MSAYREQAVKVALSEITEYDFEDRFLDLAKDGNWEDCAKMIFDYRVKDDPLAELLADLIL